MSNSPKPVPPRKDTEQRPEDAAELVRAATDATKPTEASKQPTGVFYVVVDALRFDDGDKPHPNPQWPGQRERAIPSLHYGDRVVCPVDEPEPELTETGDEYVYVEPRPLHPALSVFYDSRSLVSEKVWQATNGRRKTVRDYWLDGQRSGQGEADPITAERVKEMDAALSQKNVHGDGIDSGNISAADVRGGE